MIRPVKESDAKAIADIYNYYVTNTVITFEEDRVSTEAMADRIRTISSTYPYLVFEESGNIKGYAYVSVWNKRSAYRYTAEVTIYLDNNCIGQGIGSRLFDSLLQEVRKTSLHVLVSLITLPNEPSIRLHEKFNFYKNAHYKEVGKKFGRWLDVGNWELLL